MRGAGVGVAAALLVATVGGCAYVPADAGPGGRQAPPLPEGVGFDYQVGGDYPPGPDVGVVSRDWAQGEPLPDGYSLCYVNAFQTQADGTDGSGVGSGDGSVWPADLVLSDLGDDPRWGGEYLLDLSTARQRSRVADRLQLHVDACADKGFDAVELDNLDSWTRFDGTPLAGAVPFGRAEAVALAADLAARVHAAGMAVAQKNTPQLSRQEALDVVGFDLAVAEQCGRYDECDAYTDLYGAAVLAVEYDEEGMERACAAAAEAGFAVVRRDEQVRVPGEAGYVHRTC